MTSFTQPVERGEGYLRLLMWFAWSPRERGEETRVGGVSRGHLRSVGVFDGTANNLHHTTHQTFCTAPLLEYPGAGVHSSRQPHPQRGVHRRRLPLSVHSYPGIPASHCGWPQSVPGGCFGPPGLRNKQAVVGSSDISRSSSANRAGS